MLTELKTLSNPYSNKACTAHYKLWLILKIWILQSAHSLVVYVFLVLNQLSDYS